MLKKIFNLKKAQETIFLLKEEEQFFKNEIENFNFIINKINKKKIKFIIKNEKEIQKENLYNKTISFLGKKNFLFFPFDKSNLFSTYNFLSNYLKLENFEYKDEAFIKLLLNLDRSNNLTGKNKILYFLPFVILKSNYFPKNRLEYFLSFFPKLKFKDKSFFKKKLLGSYNNIIPRSKVFDKKFDFVIKNLNDNYSKKNLRLCLNGKAEEIWLNYFQKCHQHVQYANKLKLDNTSVIINLGVEKGTEILLFDGVKKIYNVDPFGKKFLDMSSRKVVDESDTENLFISSALYEYFDFDKKNNNNFPIKTLKQIVEENKIDKIDLIKSDIEGSERYMVDDLISISKNLRPQLAISIYHKNRNTKDKLIDSVEIPFKIMNSLKNYSFFIDHYSFERQELILYCLPN